MKYWQASFSGNFDDDYGKYIYIESETQPPYGPPVLAIREITEEKYKELKIVPELSKDNSYLSQHKNTENSIRNSIAEQRLDLVAGYLDVLDNNIRRVASVDGKIDLNFVASLGVVSKNLQQLKSLGVYEKELILTENLRRETFFHSVIDGESSTSAYKKSISKHIKNSAEIDAGKALHEKYVKDILGLKSYDEYLSETLLLKYSTHLGE